MEKKKSGDKTPIVYAIKENGTGMCIQHIMNELATVCLLQAFFDIHTGLVGAKNTQFDPAKTKNYKGAKEGVQFHFGFSLVGVYKETL